jgi:hypothetical protein
VRSIQFVRQSRERFQPRWTHPVGRAGDGGGQPLRRRFQFLLCVGPRRQQRVAMLNASFHGLQFAAAQQFPQRFVLAGELQRELAERHVFRERNVVALRQLA